MNWEIDKRFSVVIVTALVVGVSALLSLTWESAVARGQSEDPDVPAAIPVTIQYLPAIHVQDPNYPTPTPTSSATPVGTPAPQVSQTPTSLSGPVPTGAVPGSATPPGAVSSPTPGGPSSTPYVSQVTPRPTATSTAGASPTPTTTSTPGPSPTPSPTSTPRPANKFGIETANLLQSGQPMFDAGSTWTRRNALIWYEVEPTLGERRWSVAQTLEQEMIVAARLQINFILIIRGVPLWAQETQGSYCGPIAQSKLKDYATFVYEVVRRYSAPPYNVKYYEFGNEPDVLTNKNGDWWYGCWADPNDPVYRGGQKYATMLKAVYPEVKAADPSSQVVVGGMLADCSPINPGSRDCSYTRFFEGIMVGGGGPFFDVVSFHTYDFFYDKGKWGNDNWNTGYDTLGPSLVAKARYYRKVIQDYGFPNKILMDTEAALLCWMCPATQDYEIAKSWYIPELYAASLAEGVITLWYSYEGWENSGLVNSAMQPLPAFTAWRVAREKLAQTAYIGPVTSVDIGSASGVVGYKFRQGSRTVWVIRSLKTATRHITLPSLPTAITDPVGNAMPNNKNLTLTLQPIYIEWGN